MTRNEKFRLDLDEARGQIDVVLDYVGLSQPDDAIDELETLRELLDRLDVNTKPISSMTSNQFADLVQEYEQHELGRIEDLVDRVVAEWRRRRSGAGGGVYPYSRDSVEFVLQGPSGGIGLASPTSPPQSHEYKRVIIHCPDWLKDEAQVRYFARKQIEEHMDGPFHDWMRERFSQQIQQQFSTAIKPGNFALITGAGV